MEADLGIDTVKQAEVFGAIRESFGIERDDRLKLRDYPTLGHVVGFVRERAEGLDTAVPAPGAAAGTAPAGDSPGATQVTLAPMEGSLEAADEVPRRVPVPELRPDLGSCVPTGVELGDGDRVLVVGDPEGTGPALRDLLEGRGVEVGLVDPADPAAASAAAEAFRAAGAVTGVYWLPALVGEPAEAATDLEAFRSAAGTRVHLLHRTLRALYGGDEEAGPFLVSATRLGGWHGYGPEPATSPLGGAVTGYTKAYGREQPGTLVKAVDLPAGTSPHDVAQVLVEETLRDPGCVEVGRRDGERFTIGLLARPAADGGPGMELSPDSVFVVTGAAGSIVCAIVADLARVSGGTFHLLDLTPEPDRADADLGRLATDREGLQRDVFERLSASGERATPAKVNAEMARLERSGAALAAIEAVEASGGVAHYHSVDLRDAGAVGAVIDQVAAADGRIDVLVHAAGLEISRSIPDKDPDEFDLVFGVKSEGWVNLMSAAADLPIGATVVFSSVAGRFGNTGQVDYSAANDLLCKYSSAIRATRPDTRAIAIDWTAWADIGMATRGSIPTMMKMAGIEMLPAVAGIATVRRELTAGSTSGEVLVAGTLGVLAEERHPTGGLDPGSLDPRSAGPLLERVEAMGVHCGLRVAFTPDPGAQPFLDDHRIDDAAVLPGVMGVEAFAEAARLLLPGHHVLAVEDVDFLAPFKFYRDEPREVTVAARFRPDGDEVLVDCELIGERTLAHSEEPQVTVHFTGMVRMGTSPPVAPPAVAPPPGAATLDPDAIYAVYFHGPAFRVLGGAYGSGRRHGRADGAGPAARLRLGGPAGLDGPQAHRAVLPDRRRVGDGRGVPDGAPHAHRLGDHTRCPRRHAGPPPCGRPAQRRRRWRRLRLLGGRRRWHGRGPHERLPHRVDARRRCRPGPVPGGPVLSDAPSDIRRLAVINRGEAAMRLLNAVPEYNLEHGTDIRTIAFHTHPDRHAWFVREADEAVNLGPATFTDPTDGRQHQTYLDYERLEAALVESRADAAWVGWGFVSEHADFAELCERLGVTFIGPTSAVIRRLGDKVASKLLAEAAGVPVLPWGGGPAEDSAAARVHAEALGYPVLVKAAAGGGGRGIRLAGGPGDLEEAFSVARSEAVHAVGDPTVFVEKRMGDARHIEVQVVADRAGTVWAVGVRDCSIQRRNQKVIEESGSTALSDRQRSEVCDLAVRLCAEAGYTNAGTVEFLYVPETATFHFMEVNARLQVEHPVTEMTSGVDLVKTQLHVARGGLLDGDPPGVDGHAIEVRLNAEDAERDFTPSPGRVTYFRPPSGPGIRVETGVAEGDDIAPEFDSMIAKVIAWGRDRTEARARLTRAIRRCQVVIDGGTTNKSFLLGLLQHPDVIAGDVDTGWLDRRAAGGDVVRRDHADVALLQAAIEAYDTEGAIEQARFYTSAARGRPRVSTEPHRDIGFRVGGQLYDLRVSRVAVDRYRVLGAGDPVEVGLERLGPFERRLELDGRPYHTVSVCQGPRHLVEVNGIGHTVTRDEGGVVRAPAPAVVVSIAVEPGQDVELGDPLVVVESMKMETAVTAPFRGRVRSVAVGNSTQVDTGAPLLELEPLDADDAAGSGERIRVEAHGGPAGGASGAADRCTTLFESLHAQLAGYDVDDAERGRTARELGEACAELGVGHPLVMSHELRSLGLFAAICALSRRQPDVDLAEGGIARSAENHLNSYLRSPDRATDQLPERFLARLRSALSHYGIDSLERSPELEEALVWMYKSYRRLGEYVPTIMAILDRRLAAAADGTAVADEELRAVLNRLVTAAQNRYDSVAELARELRYTLFDKPLLEASRRRTCDEMAGLLDELASDPDRPGREAILDALVGCPQPLSGLLLGRFGDAGRRDRQLLLEVLVRRLYRIRELEGVESLALDGHPAVAAEYDYLGDRIHLVSVFGAEGDLPEIVPGVRRHLDGVPPEHQPVVEFWLVRSGEPQGAEDTRRRVLEVLDGVDFGRDLRRVDVAVLDGTPVGAPTQYFTFRSGEGGFTEEARYRNLHPMLGKRNDLWRLSNFEVERLPSAEDIYLFHATATENPRDERLFALAEVRDLTPVLDDDGSVSALPDLERMLMESLSAIGHYQSHRPVRSRLFSNQVILHVRPPWSVPPGDWNRLAHRLAPATRGLGLDRVVLRIREPDDDGGVRDMVLEVVARARSGLVVQRREPSGEPIAPLTEYEQKVVRTERRGATYPYELLAMLTPSSDAESGFPPGRFQEHDLDDRGRLVPVDRPPGGNTANLVVGVITSATDKHPEGMARVALLGDPSRSLGSLAEPECRRILGAIDLAARMRVPLEWYALSSGAKISMTSGTENMDWIARVLRSLIEFTQAGGEVNVVVAGVNVGAQPYFNAEATMLMHTKGILVMYPESAMVLTGKQALDFSGGVSAEDNLGIGGFDRVMGPNGQAQYFARDLPAACEVLYAHYHHSYVAPGERFPRRARTSDPVARDVSDFPHPPLQGSPFTTVGDVFSMELNPERKQPFDARTMMRALTDADHEPLERWQNLLSGDTAVVWDAHVGGIPVTLIGFESHLVPRRGFVPADGPAAWTSGTLFPMSSKKTARAINAASGSRPVVVLANLSGFDGSPESLRRLQLEFGAEIGRAVTNFDGPIVFCVVSRYHGGAFVVFSKPLNEGLEIAAVRGSRASVIGGAPAAAVVFAHEVDARTDADARVTELEAKLSGATGSEAQQLRSDLERVRAEVRSEKLGDVAEEFDTTHDINRAREVGSVDRIIEGSELRPYIVDALERGMARTVAEAAAGGGR